MNDPADRIIVSTAIEHGADPHHQIRPRKGVTSAWD
jgi:hypothetical protein